MGRPSVRLLQEYQKKKHQARKLRKKGWSYKEIADFFKISKDTAYHWTKEVNLSKTAKNRIERKIKEALRKGIIAYNRVYSKVRSQEAAKIREVWKEKAAREIKKLSFDDLKLIGSALFWAEGNKKNRNKLCFSNSDPEIVKTIMKFFRMVCLIPEEKIKARIHLYPGINQQKATHYWAKITGLPKINFQKPQIQVSRASKGKRKRNTLPYGTLHLIAGNTEITSKVKGWIQGIVEKI